MATDSHTQRLAATFADPQCKLWAVFGDELQARGDPRGELITIDQRLDSQPAELDREKLEERRDELHAMHAEQWLGQQFIDTRAWLARNCGWLRGTLRYGYLDSLDLRFETGIEIDDALADLLDSEPATYLERLSIRAPPSANSGIVAALARSPRELVELQLELVAGVDRDPSPVPEAEAAELCRALSKLRVLALVGRELFEDFAHPNLQRLRAWGHDALVGLGQWTELPHLQDLELALTSGSSRERFAGAEPSPARLTELLRADGMPELRRLDLSRNAAGCRPHSIYLGGRSSEALFELLLDSPVLERLDELVLPPPGVGVVERLLTSPRLARIPRIHIPIAFFELDEVRHQTALPQLQVGLVYRHRPVSEIHGREVMSVQIDDSSTIWVGMIQIAEIMEARYASLSPEDRAALDEIIDRFDDLAYYEDEGGPLHVDIAYSTFDETFSRLCAGFELEGTRVAQLLEALSEHRRSVDTVRLEKVWGW